MILKNILNDLGNVSITGDSGTGKTVFLMQLVKQASLIDNFDEIVIFSRKHEGWEEFISTLEGDILIKSSFPKLLMSTGGFCTYNKNRLLRKKQLVIIDGYEDIVGEIACSKAFNRFKKRRDVMKGSGYDLAFWAVKKELTADDLFQLRIINYLMDANSKVCISSFNEVKANTIPFGHEVCFSNFRLNRTYQIGEFDYKTKGRVDLNKLEEEEDYWGNF